MACEFARLRGPTWRMLESSSSPSATAARQRAELKAGRDGRHPSVFTMSNSPLRGLTTQPVSFPRRICASGLLRLSRFISTASPLPLPTLRRASRRNLGDSITSDPEMRGPAERREAPASVSQSRFRTARPHACAAWAVPRKPGRTPLGAPPWRCRPRNRSGPGTICGIRPGGCSRPAIAHGGLRPRAFRSRLYGPRSTPLPAPPAGSSPETAPHERGWRIYITSSYRSQ